MCIWLLVNVTVWVLPIIIMYTMTVQFSSYTIYTFCHIISPYTPRINSGYSLLHHNVSVLYPVVLPVIDLANVLMTANTSFQIMPYVTIQYALILKASS